MSIGGASGKRDKKRVIPYLLFIVIVGAAAYIFLPRLATLENSIKVLKSMSLWRVLLAAAAEICSYIGSGYLLKALMSLGNARFSIFRGILITLASASIGLVMGGWVSNAATTYYWVSKNDGISEESTLTGFLPTFYTIAVFIVLTGLSLLYLLIMHDLTAVQAIIYGAVFLIWVLAILLVLYGFRHRDKVERLICRAVNFVFRLLKRPEKTEAIHERISSFYEGLRLLKNRSRAKPAAGACMNVGFDMLCLFFLFLAAEHPINPMLLVAGYCVTYIVKFIFIIPGGIGIVEGGMSAIFISLGVPASVSVVVTLSYRFLSFWLPSILGFAANAYLGKIAKDSQKDENPAS